MICWMTFEISSSSVIPIQVGVKAVLRVFRALPHGYLNLPTQLSKAVGAIKAAGIYMDWLFKDDLSRQDPR